MDEPNTGLIVFFSNLSLLVQSLVEKEIGHIQHPPVNFSPFKTLIYKFSCCQRTDGEKDFQTPLSIGKEALTIALNTPRNIL